MVPRFWEREERNVGKNWMWTKGNGCTYLMTLRVRQGPTECSWCHSSVPWLKRQSPHEWYLTHSHGDHSTGRSYYATWAVRQKLHCIEGITVRVGVSKERLDVVSCVLTFVQWEKGLRETFLYGCKVRRYEERKWSVNKEGRQVECFRYGACSAERRFGGKVQMGT